MKSKQRDCRVCGNNINPFMSFGKMPIANGFLKPSEFSSEYFYELAPAFCQQCGMFQIIEQPAPEKMFHDNYAFFSSTSNYMQNHFKIFAEDIIKNVLNTKDPFVIELGSNDGIMLKHFKESNIRHLGIEPSNNVAKVARQQGIQTISKFFSHKLSKEIAFEHGHADAILAANVMCHVPNINDIAAGIAHLLKPNGVLIFEDPYLGDMITKTSYDQIYDEHVFIFSATSISQTFARHGLELIDVIPQVTHGGSMRYVLAPDGSHSIKQSVPQLLTQEHEQGLHKSETYTQFKENCEKSRSKLMEILERLRKNNKEVVGYAATSKSTTVMNYCDIGPEHIKYISDTTPLKQGKYTPGTHIPVKSHDAFEASYPDYALLFAWNHAKEIFEKEQPFKQDGGRWIRYVPKVEIIS